MDISQTKQALEIKQPPVFVNKTGEAVSDLQAVKPVAANAEKENTTSDTLSLSPESLSLAKAVTSPVETPRPIESAQQARQVTESLVSDIRNYSSLALDSFGNASSAKLMPLLA